MSSIRSIVILGASIGGLSAAHYFLRHVLRQLPSDDAVVYQVTLVDPSSKFFWRIASPRAIASEYLGPDESMFLDYHQAFHSYGNKITIIQGTAICWDFEKRQIDVKKSDETLVVLHYHALILATGTRSLSPLHSLQGSTFTDVQAALHEARKDISTAKRIIVAGGGPTGVETAGEIAEVLNGTPGWLQSQLSHLNAEVVLFTSAERLLPLLRPAIASQAERYLTRLGVKVRYLVEVARHEKSHDGKIRVFLQDGEEIEADVYIPAMGLIPMTGYAPQSLLDSKGYIRMNERTLRVDDAGPLVYAIGDVGTYSKKGIIDILVGLPVLATNLKRDLLASHIDPLQKATGPDRILKPLNVETQLLAVGQSRGVGAVFGWRVPDLVIWILKGGHAKARGGQEWVDGGRWKHSEWIVSKFTETWDVPT